MNTTKQDMQSIAIPGASNFRFSAVRPDDLGASEYTLVTIVVDESTSINGFEKELKDCVKAIIAAAAQSPRADNLLVRMVTFNHDLKEIFGFKNLGQIDINDLDDFSAGGSTALYDASDEALGATEQYASLLYDQDFDVNAAVYIITDGDDNSSRSAYPTAIADRLKSIRRNEKLESIVTLLIGINTEEQAISDILEKYSKTACFDEYIDAGDATEANLVKLAGYVSKSISSQSQALGSGSASGALSF